MNILHIISSPAAGGAEIYVKDLAKEFVRLGHSVHIGFLGRAADIGRSVEFESKFLNELDAAGIKYFFIGHKARRFPWLGVIRVGRYIRDNQINIYHAHLTYGIIFGVLVKIPRLYTHHSAKMRIGRLASSLIYRWSDQLIGISSECQRLLSNHTGRNVVTIFNGVDPHKLFPRLVMARQHNDLVHCVAVGRISDPKNFTLLIKAISSLSSNVQSKFVLLIAGEGSTKDTESLISEIKNEGLEDVIQLLGNCNDIPSLLAKSDLFVMSSSWEGLPIALIEAAMSGLPCLVTDVGGCREVIEKCENGMVVEPGNEVLFASAFESLVCDWPRLTQYSANALKYATYFSISSACEAHTSLYSMFLQKNR